MCVLLYEIVVGETERAITKHEAWNKLQHSKELQNSSHESVSQIINETPKKVKDH